ncbi:MAG: phosphoenolpyruvate synthase [Crocinitomix sp.]|nr:phosphoenolpyruvate synthase [Crocinitomix sp.]
MKIYDSQHSNLAVSAIGGKALNLYRLLELGLNVPNFAVLDQKNLVDLIPQDLRNAASYPAILKAIDAYEFPSNFLDELAPCFNDPIDKLFAVRSSAVLEDGKQFSFAGQFETHLYVQWQDLPKFIKNIWKSNFSARVSTYLQTNKLEPQLGIGVVIQEMIDPDVAGVAFGINPNTGAENSKVICSVYGVGEGLVSGELNADTFNLDGDKIVSELVKKERKAIRAASGQIDFVPVSKEEQENASLHPDQLHIIAEQLDLLEKKLGGPQDVEFAIKDETLYLLQTRPITAIVKTAGQQTGKNRIIWDNSNIVESYPGVTTPLTFSYIKTAYESVYRQLALLMGASQKTVDDNDAVFANMLGLINGRVYYNLLSWYKVLALFPGFSLNAQFMENMMGVKERFELEKDTTTSKFSAFYRTGIMLFKIVGHSFTIKKTSRLFLKDVNDALDRLKAMNLDDMSAYELKTAWIALDAELTPKWKAPVINDSFAMIYFGRLQKMIEKYSFSDNPNLQNDLLCGSKDIISVEPIHRSIELATSIGADPELKKLFLENGVVDIWEQLENHPFKANIQSYIDKFGDRCVGELKLETVSFKQDPTLFLGTLKAFVKQNVTTKSTASTIDQDLRNAAEAEVKKGLKNKPYKRYKFNKGLKKTRYFVSNRENLRYERTRVFGITREIFTAIGKCFAKNDAISHHRDIFYLTKEEIFAFIDGTSVMRDLKSHIEIRKKEFEAYKAQDSPSERITTFETVNYKNDFFNSTEEIDPNADLKGLGCCPGIVRAKVRLVKHPDEVESLDGDILVTSSTDPGWVTLFPTASAIIVERGSLLSHSAIVSREMGIPCIVGVTGLLKQLKTGDLIEMNGSTGTIKRIEDE